jgi:hypothetical protein
LPLEPVALDPGLRRGDNARMNARTRKLIGAIALLVFLALYAWIAGVIGSGRITLAPAWAQFAYFLVAGLAWVAPAGLLIRWMQRPD